MKHPDRDIETSLSARPRLCLLFARRCAVTAALAAGVVGIGSVGGCYSRPGPPETSDGTFVAFPVTVDSLDREHVIRARVGSPGYLLEIDSTWDAYRRKHVFVTIRKPDPRFTYAAVEVELNALTQVDARNSMTVFARVAEHEEEEVDDGYRQAASVEGNGAASPQAPATPAPTN